MLVALGINLGLVSLAQAKTPEERLQDLNGYPHAVLMDSYEGAVIDREVGLGSLKKVRGVWEFKTSERVSGQLSSYTWQIVDGFTSREVLDGLVAAVEGEDEARALFSCDGRSCGQAVQWANRVFHQRVLYGREDMQSYRIYSIKGAAGHEYRLVIYAASRSIDRQYVHVELLRLLSQSE